MQFFGFVRNSGGRKRCERERCERVGQVCVGV
jgi:hypothetical protein